MTIEYLFEYRDKNTNIIYNMNIELNSFIEIILLHIIIEYYPKWINTQFQIIQPLISPTKKIDNILINCYADIMYLNIYNPEPIPLLCDIFNAFVFALYDNLDTFTLDELNTFIVNNISPSPQEFYYELLNTIEKLHPTIIDKIETERVEKWFGI
jgi:hypothetical protein